MNFTTHNNSSIDPTGTYLIGRTIATYQELVDLFGEPTRGDPTKTDAEWHIRFADGTVTTIYNWKNGRAYMGPAGLPKELIGVWNVGGETDRSYELLSQAILEHRGAPA